MRIRSWTLGLIVIVFIFGGIGSSAALGYWQTESTKSPARYQSGKFAGEYNPADIRGSYTFGEISSFFNVPLEDLGKAFGIDPTANVYNIQCKDMEAAYANIAPGTEVGTDSVRVFVALYSGLPYALSANTYVPGPAVVILKEKADLTEEQIVFLETHTVEISDILQIPIASGQTESASSEEHAAVEAISGKTSFHDLLNWGMSKADIEEVIGEKLPATGTRLRDYATQKGLEFTVLKNALQAKLDALNK